MANFLARILKVLFGGLILVAAAIAALFFYFLYSPAPDAPQLSGELTRGTIDAGGFTRTYLAYMPEGLPAGSPLVVVLHSSGGNSDKIRMETGYGFERLADTHGFAIVYPDAYEGNWNGCNTIGDYSANTLDIDDVGFLTAVVDRLVEDLDVDPDRVFAAGVSRGGHMAFRLAIEKPVRYRAIAAVAANVPAAENFKCEAAGRGASSVMIMNGTEDPLNPFDGGEVTLFGLYERGRVMSSRESAQYFADLGGVRGEGEAVAVGGEGKNLVRTRWLGDGGVEIELDAVNGGGHVFPQPYRRAPRILGRTPKNFDAARLIWEFFDRQTAFPETAEPAR